MTDEQRQIHEEALHVVDRYLRDEVALVRILREVQRTKTFKPLNKSSLFVYAHQVLGLSESVAYAFNTVVRKTFQVPALLNAIEARRLTVSQCVRLVAALTPENADDLLKFAKTHTAREVDSEVGRRNPKSGSRDRIKILSDTKVQLTLILDREAFEMFERAKSLLREKQEFENGNGFVIKKALQNLLQRIDPLQKAERSAARRQKKANTPGNPKPACTCKALFPNLCTCRGSETLEPSLPKPVKINRTPLRAETKGIVMLRDQGQCTFRDELGLRCTNRHWLDVHHIVLVSEGGSDDPENLTLLCGFHHDLVHQLEFSL